VNYVIFVVPLLLNVTKLQTSGHSTVEAALL